MRVYSSPLVLCALHSIRHRLSCTYPRFSSTRMSMSTSTDWVDLQVEPDELRADLTLAMGQCFNWRRLQQQSNHLRESPGGAGTSVASDSLWIGVVDDLAIAVKQTSTTTMYKIINKPSMSFQEKSQVHARLYEYFQLKESLKELYDRWASGCSRMRAVTESLQGVRVVRQDPFECLISFICSSNNNIKRITLMLENIRRNYGEYLCTVLYIPASGTIPQKSSVIDSSDLGSWVVLFVDDSKDGDKLYSFPVPKSLAEASEEDLKKLGMGYRAKFIIQSSKHVESTGSWLTGLREPSTSLGFQNVRLYVQEQLQVLPGVGRKVADCVALFSLDQKAAIPVDVHVWDIAIRDYPEYTESLTSTTKSLTPILYEAIGDVFRDKFGPRAGWAHSVLFAAELPEFRRLLPNHMQQDMQQYSEFKKSQSKKLKESRLIHAKIKLEDELSNNKLESSTTEDSPVKLKKRKSTLVIKSGNEDAIIEAKSNKTMNSFKKESALKKRRTKD